MPGNNSSRGRPSVTRGVNAHKLSSEFKRNHRNADPQSLLTEAAMRRFVDARLCPYCGAGPFVLLASHTSRTHGIGAPQLKRAAGLASRDSITPNIYRSAAQKRLADLIDRGAIDPEGGAHAIRDKRDDEWNEIRSAVESMVTAGLNYAQIAARTGVSETTISSRLRGSYVAVRRREIYHATDKSERLAKGRATRAQRLSAQRQEIKERWERGDGTWGALLALAQDTGRSLTEMRRYLLKVGCSVPDGRSDPGRRRRTNYMTKPKSPCSRCSRDALCRGLCGMHYQRAKRAREF